MLRGRGIALLVAFGISVMAGCGGGSDDGTAAVTTNPDLTKAELVKLGDAICEKADKVQEEGLKTYLGQDPTAQADEDGQAKLALAVGVPAIKTEIEELAALGAPSGDQGKVEAIIRGLEKAVEEGEEKPAKLLGGEDNPFDAVSKLAAAYGFKACNNAF